MAKNTLENYAFSLKSKSDDPKLSSVLSESEKELLRKESSSAIAWIENNQKNDAEAFQSKYKELEASVKHIIDKVNSSNSTNSNDTNSNDTTTASAATNEDDIDIGDID